MRTVAPIEKRFWPKVEKTNDCWLWVAGKTLGYGKIAKGRASEGNARAHRVSWQLHFGAIPEGLDVLHKCDNPACVRPDHLYLGTDEDNCDDREEKGRGNHPKGVEHGCVKLTEEQVRAIREMDGSSREIADIFGVSHTLIRYIKIRKLWRHLT